MNSPRTPARNDTTWRTVTSSTSRPAEARPHRRSLEDVRACIPPKTACPGWSWEQRPRVQRTSGSEPWGVVANAGAFPPPASWSAGWLLVSGPPCDPSGEPAQSSTTAKNAGDPFSGPEKLLDTPRDWPGGVGRHPGGSWLLSWRGQRKSWTVPGQSRGYPLEKPLERMENIMLSGSIP